VVFLYYIIEYNNNNRLPTGSRYIRGVYTIHDNISAQVEKSLNILPWGECIDGNPVYRLKKNYIYIYITSRDQRDISCTSNSMIELPFVINNKCH